MSDAITLNVFGEQLQLSPRDMLELHDLTQRPGYAVLKRVVGAMDKGTRADLENPGTPLDSIRALQGRLEVATQLYSLLDDGVSAWVRKEQEQTNG